MARADFLERIRQYSFLIILGMVMWLGYASATGIITLRVPPNYVGEINSAWIGALMTMTVTVFLGWFGFYLVKGSVNRDYETRVGQIIATTPLTRPSYVLGKWLSNFAVLSLMILILMASGILMNLLAGTGAVDLWSIAAPLLIIGLPCMSIVAALAILFESISWLRHGLGNVIYFFLFILLLLFGLEGQAYTPLLDFYGVRLIGNSIVQAAQAAFPESGSGFTFSITSPIRNPQFFLFENISWNGGIIFARFLIFLMGMGVVLIASVFFDRFNPSAVSQIGNRKEPYSHEPVPESESVSVSDVHLTPISEARSGFRFDALFMAELRLLLKGQGWW